MTNRRIEEIAREIAPDLSSRLDGFEIERAERTTTALVVTFAWKQPFPIEVSISLHDYDTDQSIREEIRRQFMRVLPRFSR